ncbi:hypothetical protein WOLCODRAFT_158507 [Wolfiporia cocos MD-104 SS10]|uniref:Glyoxalase/fosfomycin resistance/dioxygenase domain-containing protein n=1 Tax=Wolfiporia cocos (strain MD-104) TaxID=742152 RepID=A0A2H3JML9_WOLCO|nr:hypothetical protein WOLCODRAFT_158507 [Wolfiporia cocos MD-104 SS10]
MPAASETAGYKFNHTTIRVEDPRRPSPSFTLYFLAFDPSGGALTAREKKDSRFSREGVLDPSFGGYASGNTDRGRGFGHIAVTVPDVAVACERFERMGVTLKQKVSEGSMKTIAFILDPMGG